ncbi:uncharacterized protein LOC112557837 isoform X2 [Pomacea canaliculata]|uniref:uncharacterized protein LOC112557837 isoform X2 n=1 Tax=Pomacea canaliculata TaxID=400727 RepID=UPI000D72AAB3|nr:uncharacterized protein LOC112557837 isoform X2 [Pomacea canaliculata]
MSRQFISLIAALCACAVVSSAQGQGPQQPQQPQQPPQPGPCTTGLEEQLPTQCFAANGVDYQGVLFLLSGNRTGAIPAGYDFASFRKALCEDKQDLIIPCVLRMMQSWNRTTCTLQDRELMMARGGQLLAYLDAICGSACEGEATQRMLQCFAAAQLDPTPFLNPNATLLSDRFPMIGDSMANADNFCRLKTQLFSCLTPVSDSCPAFAKRLYALGIDIRAMDSATTLLCTNTAQYLQALQCFANPTPSVAQCLSQSETLVVQTLDGRYRTGALAPSQFLPSLCEIKLSQIQV